MSNIGFSVPANPGIEVAKIMSALDAQSRLADASVSADRYKAKIDAVSQIVSAYIAKHKDEIKMDDIIAAIDKIATGLGKIS